jgi:hypothetical protein
MFFNSYFTYRWSRQTFSPKTGEIFSYFCRDVPANVLIEALKRNGSQIGTEKLVVTLENMRDLDIELGTPVSFGRSEYQGVHKVWLRA